MFDFGTIGGPAITAAATYLAGKAADGAAFSLGAKVIDWIKHKLTGTAEKAALEKLAAEPESQSARETLEQLLITRLQQDAALAQDFSKNFATLLPEIGALLKESGISQNASGTGITQFANKGSGNQITITIPDRT